MKELHIPYDVLMKMEDKEAEKYFQVLMMFNEKVMDDLKKEV